MPVKVCMGLLGYLFSFLFYLILSFYPSLAWSESQGPNTPGTQSGTNWTNASNVTAQDASYAVYNNTSQNDLFLTNFGYDLPTGATIDGTAINIKGYASSGTTSDRQFEIAITTDGSTADTAYRTSVLSTSNIFILVAGYTDDLGASLSLAEVESSNFGVMIRDKDTTASDLNFDYVGITVWYTPSGGSNDDCDDTTTATSVVTEGTDSGTNWTTPGNTTSDDASYARYNNTGQNNLYLTNFGLSVPTDATINGVVVRINGNGAGAVQQQRGLQMGLTKDASALSGEWYNEYLPQNVDATDKYGGGQDLWNTSLTASEVNATNFGVIVRDIDTTSTLLRVDYVAVTVCYTEAAGRKRIIIVN